MHRYHYKIKSIKDAPMMLLERTFSLAILITGFLWLTGCGGTAPKTQADFLTTELKEHQAIVINMREMADTLAVNRVVRADSFAFFREVHAMTDAEIEASTAGYVNDENVLRKFGGALKSLWPF
jgi:hypothetical protein